MQLIEPVVVIILYIITFCVIDKKSVEKERNKKEIANIILKNTYNDCLWWIDNMEGDLLSKYVVTKVDFTIANDPIVTNIENAPFDDEVFIMDFIKDGQIDKKRAEQYFEIKKLFQQYIAMRIILFDAVGATIELKYKLKDRIQDELIIID